MGCLDSVCERDNGVVHVWGACRLHAWASMVWMGVCMDASIACIDTLMACAGVLAAWIGVPPTRVGVRAFVDERFSRMAHRCCAEDSRLFRGFALRGDFYRGKAMLGSVTLRGRTARWRNAAGNHRRETNAPWRFGTTEIRPGEGGSSRFFRCKNRFLRCRTCGQA